ncbi:MAG TPA: hypothetical protein VF549_03470 [Solirubrobacteraceae bacterium]|jgi:uncharacterized protein (DUF1330 family)
MSVIMTLRASADAQRFEQYTQEHQDELQAIGAAARDAGVIAHRFYGSDSGEIMIVDEWPDAESFQGFFQSQQDRIGPMMQEAGVTSEPQVTFWRKLDTGDEVGWDA